MSKVTVTFEDTARDTVDIRMDFDPPINDRDIITPAQEYALSVMKVLEAEAKLGEDVE